MAASEGGQVGTNRGGGREEGSGEPWMQGRGGIWLWLVLPSAGRSRETWWALLQKWATLSCSWAQRPGQDTALSCYCSSLAVGIQGRETKPWSPATCRLPGLISLHPWCWVVEHIIHKPENWYERVTISLVPGWGSRGPCKGPRLPLLGGQNKEGIWVPSANPISKHHGYTDGSQKHCWGQHSDFIELKNSWFIATF